MDPEEEASLEELIHQVRIEREKKCGNKEQERVLEKSAELRGFNRGVKSVGK